MKKLVVALLAAMVGLALYAGNVLATPSSGLTTTILGKSLFGDIHINRTLPAGLWRAAITTHGSSDVYVVDNKIAPGGTTGWHSHPGPSLILVVAGTVTNYEGDECAPQDYAAGTGFVDAGGSDVHMLRNNGSATAETIAVQLLPKDAARRLEAPAPACAG